MGKDKPACLCTEEFKFEAKNDLFCINMEKNKWMETFANFQHFQCRLLFHFGPSNALWILPIATILCVHTTAERKKEETWNKCQHWPESSASHFIFFLCAAVHTRSAFLEVQVPQLVQQPLEPLRRHHVCTVYSLHRPALPAVRGEFCVGAHHLQHHPGHVLPAFHAVLLRRKEHGAQGHHDSQNGQWRSLGY